MLDVGGQDATEAFEDVGHSDEARETLEQLLVGQLKRQVSKNILHFTQWTSGEFPISPLVFGTSMSCRNSQAFPPRSRTRLRHLANGLPLQPGDPSPTASKPSLSPTANTDSAGLGTIAYAVVFIGGLAAFGAYQYLQTQQDKQA